MSATQDPHQELADRLAGFRHDPLGAVMYGFPWGEGELAGIAGPRQWQREELGRIGAWLANPATRYKPFRAAVSSGHGVGKTTFAAMLAWWAQSTFLDSMVRVTANTQNQLEKTTQPEFDRWYRRAINADWFGMLTDADTETVFLAIGNPTRNTGTFYEAVFGHQRQRWSTRVLDSRDVEGSNVEEINGWLSECEGNEDSDYFRVRARGLFPKGAAGQFIDLDTIRLAQTREAHSLHDDPLVVGCDLSWGGADDTVIRFRIRFWLT